MNTTHKGVFKIGALFLLALTILAVASALYIDRAHANVTVDVTEPGGSAFVFYQFFATSTTQTFFATTTTATSTSILPWTDSAGRIDNGYFVVAGAKRVQVYFGRGDTTGQGNSGSTQYKIQVTGKVNPGASDWIDYQKLVQATSTSQQAYGLISAATSTITYSLDYSTNAFYAIRCIAVETTDGEHACAASANY